jgi:hypothetical protein
MQPSVEKNLFHYIDAHRSAYLQIWHRIQQYSGQGAYMTLIDHLHQSPSLLTPTLDLEREVIFGEDTQSPTMPSLLCYLSLATTAPSVEPDVLTLLPFFACQAALDAYLHNSTDPVQVKWVLQKQAFYDQTKLKHIVTEQHAFLQPALCLWYFSQPPGWERSYPNGIMPDMLLGTKGLLRASLTAHTTETALPFHFGAVVPDASWLLTWALSTIKNKQEDILIDGFYDSIIPPEEEALTMLASLPDDTQAQLAQWQISSLLPGLYAHYKHYAYFLTPTCNITQLHSVQSPVSAIQPADASKLSNTANAQLDFLLVNGQDPHTIFTQLQRHLANEGFSQVHTSSLQAQLPLSTPFQHTFTQQVRSAFMRVSQHEPLILPYLPNYTPVGLLEYLHTPTILLPQRPDAPDRDDYFIALIKFFTALFVLFKQS